MVKITPQNNIIEFQLNLTNLSVGGSTPRLILEINGREILIPVEMSTKGYCKAIVPVLENFHNKKGKITIEILSEGFYFKPYETKVLFENYQHKRKTKL